MLVIPAIDLQDGRCVLFRPEADAAACGYYEDPLKMSKLWRVQNAKALHVVDLDAVRGDNSSRDRHFEILRQICHELDIPVQYRGAIKSMEEIDDLLSLGVYRVILASVLVDSPELLEAAIDKHSSSRVIAAIDVKDGVLGFRNQPAVTGRDPVDVAEDYERRGCRRIVITDLDRMGRLEGPATRLCTEIGRRVNKVRITECGGVSGFEDLMALTELAPLGVDSVVIERALYENAFPCQRFWCWHEKELVDLNAYTTAAIRDAGTGSS
jgi:phosphoribosylformimino-5-aminoimidazole carboxamide ribotide isomerase